MAGIVHNYVIKQQIPLKNTNAFLIKWEEQRPRKAYATINQLNSCWMNGNLASGLNAYMAR